VEVVGHADRAAYDLQAHSAQSKQDLVAHETYDVPKEIEVARCKPDKGVLGKLLGKNSKPLLDHLEKLSREEVLSLQSLLAKSGEATMSVPVGAEVKEFKITPDQVKIIVAKEKEHTAKYVPSVIEPSFGIGRIMYSILEHAYRQRDPNDTQRAYLALPAIVAPVKVAILPMSSDAGFETIVQQLVRGLLNYSLATKTDTSSVALGRKYARADEIGTPFACTIDFESVKDQEVTVRERDTMEQVRVKIPVAIDLLFKLCTLQLTWAQVTAVHPKVVRKDE